MVALLALGLAVGNLAAGDNSVLFLMWLHATVPAVVCGWLLMGPRLWLVRSQPAEA